MRLGEAHGVKQAHLIASAIGTDWFDLFRGRNLRPLATAAAADLDGLSFDTARPVGGGVMLRDEFLRRKHWTLNHGRRCCPQCFQADQIEAQENRLPRRWHRAWWDIQAVSVCPIHRAPLVGACQRSGDPLDFQTCHLGCCSNGHLITSAQQSAVVDYLGDAYIIGRIGGAPRLPNSTLDAGTLSEAIDCLELVGTKVLDDAVGVATHRILHAGFEIFRHWPRRFHSLLDRCVATSEATLGRWGASATYGSVHRGLYDIGNGPIVQAIKQEIREHAARSGVCLSKPVFGAKTTSARYVTVRDAARRLKMAPASTRTLLAAKGLIPRVTKRGTPIRVDVQEVDHIAVTRSQQFGVSQLAGKLGIGRMQARELAKAWFGANRRSFTDLDVDDILEQLNRSVRPQPSATDAIVLPKACQIGRCPLWLAIDAIRKGRLTPVVFSQEPGLSRIVVRLADIRQLGKISRNSLPIADVASALQVKWEVARQLAQLGLIRYSQKGIQQSELDIFRRTFVAASALAKASGIHPNIVNRRLADARIRPVASPPRCRQVFYLRSDLMTRHAPVFVRSVAEAA
jgi:Mn-dependent DtxR family transcriptional regulator